MSTGRAPMCFSKVAQSPPVDTHKQFQLQHPFGVYPILKSSMNIVTLHKLLTLHILHNHAKMSPCLKGAEHADNKRVLCKCQDVSFHKGLLDLVSQDQVLLVDLLHGKSLTGLLMPHQKHSPEWREACITSNCLLTQRLLKR